MPINLPPPPPLPSLPSFILSVVLHSALYTHWFFPRSWQVLNEYSVCSLYPSLFFSPSLCAALYFQSLHRSYIPPLLSVSPDFLVSFSFFFLFNLTSPCPPSLPLRGVIPSLFLQESTILNMFHLHRGTNSAGSCLLSDSLYLFFEREGEQKSLKKHQA